VTAAEILVSLQERFCGPQYAFLPAVRDRTGMGASRTADAMAMSLWPSRGLELFGFEIKVSRMDWLRELKAPEKSEELFGYCDRWYVVVADKSIYRPSILEVDKGDSVRIVIYASNTNHGFVLPAYGINEFLEEDNYKTIEFVADQAGEFTFFSNVYSGPGTKDMKGTLVVNE